MTEDSPFSSIEEAVEALRAGRFVVVVDDEDRENEGDLVDRGREGDAEAINFMATHGRGLICLALTEERCDALDLPPMVRDNTSAWAPRSPSRSRREGKVTTGISAADRAATVADRDRSGDAARGPAPSRPHVSRCAPSAAAC